MSKQSSSETNSLWQSRVAELRKIEEEMNASWEEQHLYEVDAPADGDSKNHYLVTFPFPYMNGRLHLGHLFTVSKAENAVRYQRMKGKKALFPFGFHCTGMPIKASADKLKRELETGVEIKAADSGKVLKSKMASKTEKNASQVEILEHIGVPKEIIPEFADPIKWLHYFPPYGVKDMKLFGGAVDWRRSFITTDVNPYFDAFVKWQFRILKEKGYVVKDKRPTICNPYDGQPCMDHDRSSGEGVQPQEYTLIKLKLVDPVAVDPQFEKCEGKPVFLLAATLRPETMIGQTNYWVKPGAKYSVVKANGRDEYYVSGDRAVQNLIAQEFVVPGDALFEIEGDKLIGAECTTPNVSNKIRGFPLLDILMNKGTGIVTSVPSDAPADLQGLIDMRKNKPMQEKYGIKPEWLDFEVIKILTTAKFGDFAAEGAIKAVNEDKEFAKKSKAEKLEEAKHRAYLDGFATGVMIIGPFKGRAVKDAKEEMKKVMVDNGDAIAYYEPESVVIARTGHECVVMKMDQWYLLYGMEEWKRDMQDHFENDMNCFHPEIREKFLKCFDWLSAWACSRQYGLGTRLPFDEQYLIDSLSDSTIYTAFYTIAHILQGDLEGSKPGIGAIKPELVNDAFFDCIFRNGPAPEGIPAETIALCKREFEFFYPVSCRVSGKDLVTNHLTMWLYNHAAIFDRKWWPETVRANGFLNLNGKKMSKSEGNFLTLVEAVEKYSVTGTRIALADGGDGSQDANFTDEIAVNCIGRIFQIINLIKKGPETVRENLEGFFDTLMDAKISKAIIDTDAAYARMCYRDAQNIAFFGLMNSWSEYLVNVNNVPAKPVLDRYIETILKLMTPIAPQFTDYCWTRLLGHKTTIVNEPFPEPMPFDSRIFFEDRFLFKTAEAFRNRMKKVKKYNRAAIFVVLTPNELQQACLEVLRSNWDAEKNAFDEAKLAEAVKTHPVISKANKRDYMAFYNFYKQSTPEFGAFLLAPQPEIDQLALLSNNKPYITKCLKDVEEVEIIEASKAAENGWDPKMANEAIMYMTSAGLMMKQ